MTCENDICPFYRHGYCISPFKDSLCEGRITDTYEMTEVDEYG